MKLSVFNRLTALLVIVTMLAPLAPARTRKGDGFFKNGKAAEVKEDWDKALDFYEQAMGEDPSDAAYVIGVQRTRMKAGQKHVETGQKLKEAGKIEEAAAEFQKAYATDPSSPVAAQELRRALALLEQARRLPAGTPFVDPAQVAREADAARLASMLPIPVLKPTMARYDSLVINNQPTRVLFDTVAKVAGLNIIYDPDFQPAVTRNLTVDVSRLTPEQALDYLALLTKVYWKPLSPNTIFVTMDNVTKRRDYEEFVVKAYYLKNVTAATEVQEIATVLRTLVNIALVMTYNAQNMILVRGEADKIALADKVIADLDKPKAEVVVDVIVMEVNRARTRDLAATLVSGGTNGISSVISSTPRTGVGIGNTGNIRLSNLSQLNGSDWAVTVPNALLEALMSDRGTRVVQSPQLRATHMVKSSMKIGDKYPYASSSQSAAVSTGGIPLANTSFQFADVGVTLDITPTIHSAEDVTLQIDVNVSQIRDRIDVGGVFQPVIGQRNVIHTVRLRSGEVSLLGGLTTAQETKSVSGIPGLASIPWLGRLFSSEGTEKNESELAIVMVPHVIRAPDITELNTRGIAAGSQQVVKVSYAPQDDKPVVAPGATPVVPGASVAPPPTPTPGGPFRLAFQPSGTMAARVGEAFTLDLRMENAMDVMGAPTVRVTWDPRLLRLDDATLGPLFSGDGQRPVFTRNVRNDAGEVGIVLSRMPGTSAITGTGTVTSLNFRPLAPGNAQIRVAEARVVNGQNQPVAAEPPAITVTIQQ
jgi:general secretion pathway protein D